MGRPREHDERTAAALLAAAERKIEEGGADALSVRDIAQSAGTTTRAVYSLFGSKDGLVGALGQRAFELLQEGLADVDAGLDPRACLIEAALMFRRFALRHPALFSIAFHRADPVVSPRFSAARAEAFAALGRFFDPLAAADLLGGRTIGEAATQFHALCEGLAALELRHAIAASDPERIWRTAFQALIVGFGDPVH
jgi:AcrR family transcriptional regulator